jgi:hypothetical protein
LALHWYGRHKKLEANSAHSFGSVQLGSIFKRAKLSLDFSSFEESACELLMICSISSLGSTKMKILKLFLMNRVLLLKCQAKTL